MTEFWTAVPTLAGWAWTTVLRLPHLYLVAALYALAVAVFLVQRYVLQRDQASRRTATVILLIAGAGALVAAVDLAVRKQVDFVHLSLVTYLATSLGVARMVVRTLDRSRTALWPAFWLRSRSYLTLFAVAVLLSAIGGNTWWFDLPRFTNRDLLDIMNNTNWLHLGATAAALALPLDLLNTAAGRTPWGRKATHV